MKQFGKDNTHLRLTDKAQEFYNSCVPLRIYEHEYVDGSYRYSVTGCFEKIYLSEDEVINFLESLSDAMSVQEEKYVTREN